MTKKPDSPRRIGELFTVPPNGRSYGPFGRDGRSGERRDDDGIEARSERSEETLPPALAVIAAGSSQRQVRALVEQLRTEGISASVYDVGPGVVILASATDAQLEVLVAGNAAIERAFRPDTRYRLARREVRPEGGITVLGGVPFGGDRFPVIAGPCAVEDRSGLMATANACARLGASVLRGGAFKPRSSPYAFPGLGPRGVELLSEARAETGLPFVTEIMDAAHIEWMHPLVDAFQVGARNMQNFDLLRALSDVDKPVILKRGFSATVEDWLLAAEYVLAGGNDQLILCERGIRTFNSDTRFTLDLASMALAKRATHLPIIVDPSHATGRPELVAAMACAAMAAGADGVMVEVHHAPSAALSDGDQALTPEAFADLMERLRVLGAALGRLPEVTPLRAPKLADAS